MLYSLLHEVSVSSLNPNTFVLTLQNVSIQTRPGLLLPRFASSPTTKWNSTGLNRRSLSTSIWEILLSSPYGSPRATLCCPGPIYPIGFLAVYTPTSYRTLFLLNFLYLRVF